MTRIGDRVPQITDDILFIITLPDTTETWADDILSSCFNVKRNKRTGELSISKIICGNTGALASGINFLHAVEDELIDSEVNPMNFTLKAMSMVTDRPKTVGKKRKKIQVKSKKRV